MKDLDNYLFWLSQNGRKASTVRHHQEHLLRVLRLVAPLTVENFKSYLSRLLNTGRTANYINDIIIVIRLYTRFIGLPGFEEIREFKEYPSVKATLSDAEIHALLELPPPRNGEKEKRNYGVWTLFFTLLATTGMRPSEVAHLKIESCDIGRGVFILSDTKTNAPRYVPIPPSALQRLTDHIQQLSGEYLFPSGRGGSYRQGKVVNDVDWGYNFHSRLKRLGIKRKNLTLYSLRHSFITRMLEEDINIFKVQKIVGHRKLDTTAIYSHMTTKDIIQTIKKDRLTRNRLNPNDALRSVIDTIKSLALETYEGITYSYTEGVDSFTLTVKIK